MNLTRHIKRLGRKAKRAWRRPETGAFIVAGATVVAGAVVVSKLFKEEKK